MPLVDFYWPQRLSPLRFDRYLAAGWFRSGNSLYKTRIVCLEADFHSPVNIRVDLNQHQWSKRMRKLARKNRSSFSYRIQPLRFIDSQRERLYQQHKHRFKGFVCHTLEEYLMGVYRSRIFDSYEVTLWDANRLIAWSCFDLGLNSAAGIMGLFDHDYAHYSLGKQTMIEEVDFLKKEGFKYYYPGYILDGSRDFDYKLALGSIQFRQHNGYWRAWDGQGPSESEALTIKEKTEAAMQKLRSWGLEPKVWIYPMHAFGYLEGNQRLLKCPVFIQISSGKDGLVRRILFYDYEDATYRFAAVFNIPKMLSDIVEPDTERPQQKIWSHLISLSHSIDESADIEKLKTPVLKGNGNAPLLTGKIV